jgi:chromosome segregation ATPase
MVENESININILERLILFLNSEHKNASKYLENKNADYLKLIKFQKEKDAEYEHEITVLKQYKEKEQQNAINYRIERQNFEDEIKELKEYSEKIKKDYEREIKTLRDQISVWQENLNNEKKKNHNLIEENKYKESIIDEKEKSIAQLLNQMAEADTEIEHNEKLRKELTILQNDLFNTQKKLKSTTNSEQEIKAKLTNVENNLDLAINEKKQTIEELNKLKIQIDTIKKENEALSKEKASSSNEFTEFKNKLNEKSNKIKFLEEKIVELTTNNTSSKASLESMNKKITEFENKIISLNKEKNEITIKCENDIKLLKAAQGKELENCKTSYEKDCSLLKMKFENELESVKNNFSKQIETNNSKNKSLDEKYANLPQFISNLFSFYEENDGMISINQTKMTSILERFNEIKSNFGLLETTISEVSVDDNSNINKNKIRIYNKLDDASEKVEHLIEKCKNFEKVKEKIESILTRSDEIISKTGLNFVNLDKVKKKLIKSNKKAYIRKQ